MRSSSHPDGLCLRQVDVKPAIRRTACQPVAETMDAVEKLVAARVASLSTRRVERLENSCSGSVRVIPL